MGKFKFPSYRQLYSTDCGPTSLRIIAKYYGREFTLAYLKKLNPITKDGISLYALCDLAEKIGFKTLKGKLDFKTLKNEVQLPCIAFWDNNHFLVIYKVTTKYVFISDPAHGLIKYSKKEFLDKWISIGATEHQKGIVLLLETSPKFYDLEKDPNNDTKRSLYYYLGYFKKYKKLIIQIFLGFLAGSIFQLFTPFLTQSIVDIGIQNQDINFIYLILIAQIILFLSQTSIGIIRSWIFLHMSTRIGIAMISDFFIKLMSLPISYFDNTKTGDIIQRVGENSRIQSLITSTPLSVFFSLLNLFVFAIILGYYSPLILVIFLTGSALNLGWILLFLKKRKNLDYKSFSENSAVQSNMIELVQGMQEIKQNNAERAKRWEWEHLQINLFKISVEGLVLSQTQGIGSTFIEQLKNILISVISAKLVIEGEITLGMMVAIGYIVGQLNSPISQLVGLSHTLQDAKISLERLDEIFQLEDEESKNLVDHVPPNKDIAIHNLNFTYDGSHKETLSDITVTIPNGKVTAIVGHSGSGKTTLLKLLLKYYPPTTGKIKIGELDLNKLSYKSFRAISGTVMQEGFIFNDTIKNNIAVGHEDVDWELLEDAAKIANIYDFIESLPLSFNTKIGGEGTNISGGEKQRLLIARAIYKNPRYLFLDEATSSIDVINEKQIIENIGNFSSGRTVIVVAHRLSTILNADQIIVLDNGRIVEVGNHKELLEKKGVYFTLVKTQLHIL
jgi:ATP-binding cassette subfamily B protein